MTQLQESEDEKKEEGEAAEKKDDSIVYADLDKSAMSEGKRPSVSIENEKSEYAEITPQPKEWLPRKSASMRLQSEKKERLLFSADEP